MKMIALIGRILILVSFLSLFAFPQPAPAKMISYVKEYTYQASEVDSKLTSRTVALEQVKRLLLEEIGTYLVSETEVKDFKLTKDHVYSYAAGIVMTVILEEKWDGRTYFIRAKVTSDTDDLVKSIDQIRSNKDQEQGMEELKKKTEMALREIERLKDELKGKDADKAAKGKYTKAVNELNALDWYRRGHALRFKAKNYEKAMAAFSKAIEIDPGFAPSYAGRASIYIEWGQFQKALSDGEKAVKIDPNLAWGYNMTGSAYIGLKKFKKAIELLNKAIELSPNSAWAYVNRSLAYFALKNYDQSLADADRAIQYDPKLPSGYLRKARTLAALNNTEEAFKNFDKAIELDPASSPAFLHRGYLHLKLGNSQQGMEDMKKAASLGNSEAKGYLSGKGIQWQK